MEATIKNMNSNQGLNLGTVSLNFPCGKFIKLGLVRTNSIHTPYKKLQKSSGLLKAFKMKKSDFKTKSNFLCGPRWTRTTDPLIMSQML